MRYGLLLGLLLFACQLSAQTLVSRVDRSQISINESVQLALEYDQRVDSRAIDLAPLQQDFEILNNSTSSQVSIINGRQEVSTRWTLTLLPRRTGTLVIPSFRIGNDFSQAIEVEVREAAATGPRSQPISVEVDVNAESVRVGEQLLVTVRLVAAANVSNLAGDSMALAGAEGQMLDQRQFTEWQGDAAWQVIEWRYALFPDAAGVLEIPSQSFSGLVGAGRSMFDVWSTGGQRVVGRSPARQIQVLAAPDTGGRAWFPANQVRIESEWQGGQAEVRVGEPITRTISIFAEGQRPEVIPPLNPRDDENFRVYADQPELIRQTTAENLVGIRRQSIALVPSREGELLLPEVRLPWWDSNAGEWREARLPAQRIQVLPAAVGNALTPPATLQSAIDPSLTAASGTPAFNIWMISTLALALLCLALLFERSRRAPVTATAAEKSGASETTGWSAVRTALKNADISALRRALDAWAMANTGRSGSWLLTQLPAEARAEWQALERARYGAAGEAPANLRTLTAALEQMRKQYMGQTDAKPSPLAELYPENR